ncbi:MAG TPA: MgtC/SapB family protein [Caulobacteraceae bacterium]|nr:MgtC/SapB family protein [Caulobacteraceae bacterium]
MSPTTHIALNLAAAWLAGSLVGLERSYNGRVAGFRTHGLVALASAVIMSIAFAPRLMPGAWPAGQDWLEPTRLAQGVMAGVGFLGAGVIFKEGVNVQGLTTAASIWATAAIGLALGLGLFWPGALATGAVLFGLTLLRMIEAMLPSRIYALATFRFLIEAAPSESGLHQILGGHDVTLQEISFRRTRDGRVFEFEGALATNRKTGFASLAERLKTTPGLVEFNIERISK